MASARLTFNAHTEQSIREGAERSMRGEVDDNQLRRVPVGGFTTDTLTPDGMMKTCEDLYCRKTLDIQAGRNLPQRFSSWKKATDEFDIFLRVRIGTNWERLMAHEATAVAVAVMPFCARVKEHPSMAQANAWQKRWDDDGDLCRFVKERCPGALMFPVLLWNATDAKSHVQFNVVIVRPPTGVMPTATDMD